MPKPRVFVAMPFRTQTVRPAAGSAPAVAADFDLVYRLLLAPALERAGCEAFRADEEPGAGDIRVDMFFELVTADAVIADISILNPNVFYELGVRHGVAPRGVFLVRGGWQPRPFDVSTDRTFAYDGSLFEVPTKQDGAWNSRVRAEVDALSQRLAAALDADPMTVGSPVYELLPGLKPVDWSDLKTARARFFRGVLDDWKRRVQTARARGHAGDILTLAEDAPTRYHQGKLLFEAARSLIDLERYDTAKPVLEELLRIDPSHLDAQCQLGLVRNRLGDYDGAEAQLQALTDQNLGEPELQGILGRICKDRWRVRWEREASPDAARRSAVQHSALAAAAIRCYAAAARRHLDSYYNGVNVVGLVSLLEALGKATGKNPAAHGEEDVATLTAVVRLAATQALKTAQQTGKTSDAVWAQATLGELAVIDGDAARAEASYRDAAAQPGTTWFQIDSMLQQLQMYERLEFRAEAVRACIDTLQSQRSYLARPAGTRPRVLIFAGHMIDKHRAQPRFPPGNELAVAAELRRILEGWKVGKEDLAICGGARGGDILFAEICRQLGARVRLYLPLAEPEFIERSVRLDLQDSGRWVERFRALRETCETAVQSQRLGEPATPADVFARNNRWIVNTARAEAAPHGIHAIMVWDGKQGGDGAGGTADFAGRVRALDGTVKVVDPMQPQGG
jgi:tetratricopeptide (TPR) repeat protein